MISKKRSTISENKKEVGTLTSEAIEGMMEQRIEDLATFLRTSDNGKSRLHEDILTIVEKSLFKIALKRSDNIKSKAATYLGINRNTFQKKLLKLGINCQKD